MKTLNDLNAVGRYKTIVSGIYATIQRGHAALLKDWNQSVVELWGSDCTAELLAEMGTYAATAFAHSSLTITLLETVEPGCCSAGMAMFRPFTINEDGTVTLD